MPAPVSPPLITALSTPPQTTDIANFDTRADTHVLETQALVPELNTANLNVYNNALSAYNAAINAAISQTNAAASATQAFNSNTTAAAAAAAAQAAIGLPALKAGRLLRTDGSTVSWDVVDGATKYATTDFGAVVGATYDVNTVLGIINATTPNNPVADDWFQITDTGNAGTNNIIVKRGGTNLLTFPEDLSNAAWTKSNVSVTANAAMAPDGTLTADRLTVLAASDPWAGGLTVTSSQSLVHSIYVKNDGALSATLRVITYGSIGSHDDPLEFTFATKTFSGAVGGNFTAHGYVDVGGGWYRLWAAKAAIAGQISADIRACPEPVATKTCYFWGAKVEVGSSASFYDPVTVSTNLLTYSEQFDSANWGKGGTTVTVNAAVAPDGTLTADKLVETATTREHYAYQLRTGSNETVTQSAYVKADGQSKVAIKFSNTLNAAVQSIYDIALGVVVSVDPPNADYTNLTATMYPAGNGWWRCVFTATKGNLNTINSAQVSIVNAANNLSYLGDINKGLYVWGMQLETGTIATPYIKTVATSASRVAGNPTRIMGLQEDLTISSPNASPKFVYLNEFRGWVVR